MKEKEVSFWCNEITLAQKREEVWSKEATRVTELYEAGKREPNSFNILWSNTETLLPAVYNSLPRPVVNRRYKDADPVGLASSQAALRFLDYFSDTPESDYESFDAILEDAALGALVPGRGMTRLRYDARFEPVEESKPKLAEEEPTEASQGGSPVPGAGERVTYERVCSISVPHDTVLFGYAKRWKNLPWLAYLHNMTREDLEANFGKAKAQKIKCYGPDNQADDPYADKEEVEKSLIKTAPIWEVWHKAAKKVYFISKEYKEDALLELEDPLGLSGFYDMPEPLAFTKRVTGLVPVTLYSYYEEQAKELNRVSRRINRIIEALKVRGFYDAALKDLSELFQQDDNTLLAAKNVSALGDAPNLDRHIWLMPLEKLVQVLSQLYLERQQTKQVIYEITGISDILRGSSVASETATAQQIKNQWGTMRLRRMQRRVQRYVRDCLRMALEIAASKFSEETWAVVTGLPFLREEEKQAARTQLQQLQMQVQMNPPPTPEAAQQFKQQVAPLVQRAQQMDWGQVLRILRDDIARGYRIDIETNSTVDLESTEDQKNITEVLGAMAQIMQGLGPMVEKGVLPLGAAKAMLLTVTRRFRFGMEIEEQLMKIPDQLPEQPDPAEAKGKVELQVIEAEAKAKMQQMQQDAELQKLELSIKQQELGLKRQELELKKELMVAQHQAKLAAIQAKAQEAMIPQPAPARSNGRATV